MDKEPMQLLKDVNIKPTNEIIKKGLGDASNTYNEFIDGLEHNDISLMDWRYYNDGKAWLSRGEYKWTTARGTNKVKPIFWISVWEDFFKVSFYFSEAKRTELLALPLSKETKEIIKDKEAMGKTKKLMSIVFDVNNEKQLEDIYTLAQFRKENI